MRTAISGYFTYLLSVESCLSQPIGYDTCVVCAACVGVVK